MWWENKAHPPGLTTSFPGIFRGSRIFRPPYSVAKWCRWHDIWSRVRRKLDPKWMESHSFGEKTLLGTITYPGYQGSFESMSFRLSRLVGYVNSLEGTIERIQFSGRPRDFWGPGWDVTVGRCWRLEVVDVEVGRGPVDLGGLKAPGCVTNHNQAWNVRRCFFGICGVFSAGWYLIFAQNIYKIQTGPPWFVGAPLQSQLVNRMMISSPLKTIMESRKWRLSFSRSWFIRKFLCRGIDPLPGSPVFTKNWNGTTFETPLPFCLLNMLILQGSMPKYSWRFRNPQTTNHRIYYYNPS